MRMRKLLTYLLLFATLASPLRALAQEVLVQDFGALHNLGEEPGESLIAGASRAAGADDDVIGVSYIDSTNHILAVVAVQIVTDPNWLVHELEGAFRSPSGAGFESGVSIADSGSRRRFDAVQAIGGDTTRIVAWTAGTSRIVSIKFDLRGPNRWNEVPLAIVDSYLALHPSSLPAVIDDSQSHHQTWIRDEMRRLLEYSQRDLSQATVTSQLTPPATWRDDARRLLRRFADYRGRFYGVGSGEAFDNSANAADRQNAKPDGSVDPVKQQAWLQARLEEFQNWWAAHQNDPVQFPAPTPTPVATPTP